MLDMKYYSLDKDHNIRTNSSLMEWAKEFEASNRQVGNTQVGPYRVSTVFLGIDHSFSLYGPPLLFETMVFHKNRLGAELYMDRYSTWDEAVEGHKKGIKFAEYECTFRGKMQRLWNDIKSYISTLHWRIQYYVKDYASQVKAWWACITK